MPQADPLFTFQSYFKYFIQSKGAHSVHSPLVYKLYQDVLKPSRNYRIESIESIRKEYKRSISSIHGFDFGKGKEKTNSLSAIGKKSLSNPKFGAFLYLLCKWLEPSSILETGSSLGISTAYLASHNPNVPITTVEGNQGVSHVAEQTFQRLELENVNLVQGNMYEVLPDIVEKTKPEIIFHDADHRSESVNFLMNTIESNLNSTKVIVIHDIYWSKDMNHAWKSIVDRSDLTITVDVFEAGIVFPRVNTPKQHFVLKF